MIEELILTYCTHLESEGKSPKTIQWHKYSLQRFSRWLDANGQSTDPTAWTAPMIRTYLVALKRPDPTTGAALAPHSVKSYASSLRSFCRWLHLEEFTVKDVMERVKQPSAPRLVKPTLSADETRRLLASIKCTSRNALRDEALLLFLLDTGIRANELCTLRLTDLDWTQRIAKVFGKGGKERYVPFSAHTMKALQRYGVKERRGTSGKLFETEEGAPLTASGLLQLCKRIGVRAGVDLNPHKCRHTFAISYLRNGASVFALQKTLGHTTLDMTLRYSALLTDDLVSEHREHSPVAALLSRL